MLTLASKHHDWYVHMVNWLDSGKLESLDMRMAAESEPGSLPSTAKLLPTHC